MPEKLYNIEYLEQTTNLLKEIKEHSYAPFKSIKTGSIIDVGCGTGIDVFNLASLLDPSVKIFGLDYDQQMIAKAKATTSNLENIEFKVSDAEQLPFEDASLSGIRNERLIQHLKQPEKVFNEFYRILKPNHPIVIVETDWSSVCIYNGIPKITNKVKDFLSNEFVTNGAAAINLSYYLLQSKFKQYNLSIYPFISHSLSQVNTFMKLDYALEQMEQKKYISEEEHEIFVKSLQKADAEGSFLCSINFIIASGIK